MAFAPMIAATAYAAVATEGKYYDHNTKTWKDIPPKKNELADWEKDSFTKRLARLRAGSHCKGCGAPLHLTEEGACEYCGLKP